MIRNFNSKTAKHIFNGTSSRFSMKLPLDLHAKARRLLDQINAATKVETLNIPPGNKLEKPHGNLNNFWSIRINKQWRIIFKWINGEAVDIDITDYH